MRCTRCDRIAVPQAVGRTPDGIVAFGWCRSCLEEAGCTLIEVEGRGLEAAIRSDVRRRVRPGPIPEARSRRGVLTIVSGILATWASIVLLMGVARRVGPPAGPTSPLGNGTPWLLLVGGAGLAAMSLVLWAATLPPATLDRVALRIIRIALTALGFGVLVYGIAAYDRRRGAWVASLALLALGASAVLRRAEWRRGARPALRNEPNLGSNGRVLGRP